MTQQEILNHTEVVSGSITGKPKMAIMNNAGNMAKASRILSEQEVYAYAMVLVRYMVNELGATQVNCSNGEKITFTYSKGEED